LLVSFNAAITTLLVNPKRCKNMSDDEDDQFEIVYTCNLDLIPEFITKYDSDDLVRPHLQR
jgi:hypothetical protein